MISGLDDIHPVHAAKLFDYIIRFLSDDDAVWWGGDEANLSPSVRSSCTQLRQVPVLLLLLLLLLPVCVVSSDCS